ncbi:lipopolysaccharide biosynthesis protein [Aerococcus urinaeequi]
MNLNVKDFLKNLFYSISSNLLSLIVSVLTILIIPKLIGVTDYGYWQLYLFYATFIGVLHFGWVDGIYLRYGGDQYRELDKQKFNSQWVLFFISQLIVFFILIMVTSVLDLNTDRKIVLYMTAIELLIVNPRLMLLYIMQATNKIKDYSRVMIADRLIYVVILTAIILLGNNNYVLMIIADLIAKAISLIIATWYVKEIIYRKISDFKMDFIETYENVSAGIKLMISNISSNLIVGVVKIGIERNWSIDTFGQVSLTLSASNLIVVFINAVSIIIYPILRRVQESNLAKIYMTIRNLLMPILFGSLMIYYPLFYILSFWLPNYIEGLRTMAILFPMVVFQSQISLLINTFYKTLRMEKELLYINIFTVIISILITILSSSIMNNLNLTIFSIVILLWIKTIISEEILNRKMKLNLKVEYLFEIILVIVFVVTSVLVNSIFSTVIYGMFYGIYVLINKNKIIDSIKFIKKFTKK